MFEPICTIGEHLPQSHIDLIETVETPGNVEMEEAELGIDEHVDGEDDDLFRMNAHCKYWKLCMEFRKFKMAATTILISE